MKFITLITANGSPVYMNVERIEAVTPEGAGAKLVSGGREYIVINSVAEVFEAMHGSLDYAESILVLDGTDAADVDLEGV